MAVRCLLLSAHIRAINPRMTLSVALYGSD